MKKYALLGSMVLMFAACATAPLRPSDAERVQPARFAEPNEGTGAITVTRDGGTHGMGCSIEVQIEGETVGTLWRRQTMTLHLPPGEVIVAVKPKSPCGIMDAGRGLREAEVNLRASRPLFFRVGYSANGLVQFSRTGLR